MSKPINMESIEELFDTQNSLIQEQNNLIKDLTLSVKSLIEISPDFIPLARICEEIGKSNQTLSYHLTSNYEPEKDFKKKNGKIIVDSRIALLIKEHYVK